MYIYFMSKKYLVIFNEKLYNEAAGELYLWFSTDKELVQRLFPKKYPCAERTSIEVMLSGEYSKEDAPITENLLRKVICRISPMKKIDGLDTDYDWHNFTSLSKEEIRELIKTARGDVKNEKFMDK